MTDQEKVKLNRFALVFEMPEEDVKEIEDAVIDYCHSSVRDKDGSYKDWCDMYDGIYHESTFDLAFRNWLACVRWMNRKNASQSLSTETGQQGVDVFTVVLTSVGTELISFRMQTDKITDEEETKLIDAIVKRIIRKINEYKIIVPKLTIDNLFSETEERLSILLDHVSGDEEKCVRKIQDELTEIKKHLSKSQPQEGQDELWYNLQDILDAVQYGFRYHRDSQNDGKEVPRGNILQWLMNKKGLTEIPESFKK